MLLSTFDHLRTIQYPTYALKDADTNCFTYFYSLRSIWANLSLFHNLQAVCSRCSPHSIPLSNSDHSYHFSRACGKCYNKELSRAVQAISLSPTSSINTSFGSNAVTNLTVWMYKGMKHTHHISHPKALNHMHTRTHTHTCTQSSLNYKYHCFHHLMTFFYLFFTLYDSYDYYHYVTVSPFHRLVVL